MKTLLKLNSFKFNLFYEENLSTFITICFSCTKISYFDKSLHVKICCYKDLNILFVIYLTK